jgi:dihydrofolate synthase/folylpolyglutamate synthase
MHTLADWLRHQETLHPRVIDLGLERVARVCEAMGIAQPTCPVITVAGTNGKGSTVAFLDAILRAQGYRTGVYTSPHLLRYNERIRVDGSEVDDATLCASFARIEAARGNTTLSYFEFGTLAAFDLLTRAGLDAWILEVGLGGRLDAVNLMDADVAVISSIGLDHCDYLGPDREHIAREKAGILRAGRPGICGDMDPPRSLLECAERLAAPLAVYGRDFRAEVAADGWRLQGARRSFEALPLPSLNGAHQIGNAACALMALDALHARLPVSDDAVRAGLRSAYLAGRFQIVPGVVEQILDVAHNPHGAAALVAALRVRACTGRTHAVLAMYADKDVEGYARALSGVVDRWYCASLTGERGQSAEALAARLVAIGITAAPCGSVHEAHALAIRNARPGDRALVCGSFQTVAAVLA